jgi:hypothetical protein
VRDHLRASNTVLKEKQGFIGSDLLVGDFEGRKGSLASLLSSASFPFVMPPTLSLSSAPLPFVMPPALL